MEDDINCECIECAKDRLRTQLEKPLTNYEITGLLDKISDLKSLVMTCFYALRDIDNMQSEYISEVLYFYIFEQLEQLEKGLKDL